MPFSSSTILVMIINGVGVPSRLIPPYFADKIGPVNILVPVLFGTAIAAYAWLAVHNTAGLYVFTAMYGLIQAAFQCLIPTTVASMTSDLNKVGTRLGMTFSVLSFAALTGPPIGGALLAASNGSYVSGQAWAASATLIGAFLALASRASKVGWKLKVKC